MTKMLAELIPFEEIMKNDESLDFGKCKTCGKNYQIYHLNGVCIDCDIENRMKADKEFRQTIEQWGEY